MLTNRIAAALATGLGLGILLAAVVILVWWNVSGRQSPLQIIDNPAGLEAQLESAPYIALNAGDRPVYVIAPRGAQGLDRWLSQDAAELAERGRQVRVIMLPSDRGNASQDATVTELWLDRNIDLLAEWLSMPADHWTPIGIEPVTASPHRLAALAEARALARNLMQAVGQGRDDARWPLIVWRDGAGQLAACLCESPAAAAKARYALRLTGHVDTEERFADADDAGPPAPDHEAGYEDFDDNYPRLTLPSNESTEEPLLYEQQDYGPYRTPSPLLPGDVSEGIVAPVPPAPSAPAARSAPSRSTPAPRPRPAPRELNTAPPKAEKDAESLFY